MKPSGIRLGTVLLQILAASTAVFACHSAMAAWTYQDIYVTGSLITRATDINNLGQITGYYQDPNSPTGRDTGFIISNGNRVDIPIQNPWGINNAGTVVGYSVIGGTVHGQIYSGGTLTQIDKPGAFNTQLFGINDAGVAIGTYGTEQNPYVGIFTYSGGVFTELGIAGVGYRIENDGTIFGVSNGGFSRAPDGTISRLNYVYAGSTGLTYMFGRNAAGDIVGFGAGPGVTDRSYVYSNGTFIPLDYPSTSQTQAYGINDAGYVVGHWHDFGNNIGHGFIAIPCDPTACNNGPVNPVISPNTLLLLAFAPVLLPTRSGYDRAQKRPKS